MINGFKLDERVGKEAQLLLRTYERRNLIWAGASGQDFWEKECLNHDLKIEQKLDGTGRGHFKKRKRHMQR